MWGKGMNVNGSTERTLRVEIRGIGGGTGIISPDMPELIIFSSDREQALNDLLPTVEALVRLNYGAEATAYIASADREQSSLNVRDLGYGRHMLALRYHHSLPVSRRGFSYPEIPKFDVGAFLAIHRANFETVVAAQWIFFDLAQTVAKRQAEFVNDAFAHIETAFKAYDAEKQPAAYVDEMTAVVEKAMADVRETMDLGIKAQSEIVDLFVQRATRSLEHVKALAA